MIYLLYGDNQRASRLTLDKFIKKFESHAPHGWRFVDFANQKDFPDFASGGLFAKKEYAIIKNASLLDEEMIDRLLAQAKAWQKDESVVVFFEGGIPRGNTVFNKLKKMATIEEFSYPSSGKLELWAKQELLRHKKNISPSDMTSLMALYAKDPESFYIQFEKVLLGGDILLGATLKDSELFELGDAWGRRDKARSIFLLERLLRHGFEPDSILRTLLWHVKNLLLVSSGRAGELKPFVANKALSQARNFQAGVIEENYLHLMKLDEKREKDLIEVRLLHFLLTH